MEPRQRRAAASVRVYAQRQPGSAPLQLGAPPAAPGLGAPLQYHQKDVASSLHYLHEEYDQRVVHRDLKASNIMLHAAFSARLGDFGLAHAIDEGKTSYMEELGTMGSEPKHLLLLCQQNCIFFITFHVFLLTMGPLATSRRHPPFWLQRHTLVWARYRLSHIDQQFGLGSPVL